MRGIESKCLTVMKYEDIHQHQGIEFICLTAAKSEDALQHQVTTIEFPVYIHITPLLTSKEHTRHCRNTNEMQHLSPTPGRNDGVYLHQVDVIESPIIVLSNTQLTLCECERNNDTTNDEMHQYRQQHPTMVIKVLCPDIVKYSEKSPHRVIIESKTVYICFIQPLMSKECTRNYRNMSIESRPPTHIHLHPNHKSPPYKRAHFECEQLSHICCQCHHCWTTHTIPPFHTRLCAPHLRELPFLKGRIHTYQCSQFHPSAYNFSDASVPNSAHHTCTHLCVHPYLHPHISTPPACVSSLPVHVPYRLLHILTQDEDDCCVKYMHMHAPTLIHISMSPNMHINPSLCTHAHLYADLCSTSMLTYAHPCSLTHIHAHLRTFTHTSTHILIPHAQLCTTYIHTHAPLCSPVLTYGHPHISDIITPLHKYMHSTTPQFCTPVLT